MEPECDFGSTEYKLKLLEKDEKKIEHLSSQMRYRCEQGEGECIYHIGVQDDGNFVGITQNEYEETLKYLGSAAQKNNYSVKLLTTTLVKDDKYIYELLIRENNNTKYIDIKVAIAGGVNSGKSSTIGVLTSGKLDNGSGSARSSIFNFTHELKSGKTSSIGHYILGFDSIGNIVNYNELEKINNWQEIISKSQKVISLYDLAGHEKYLKTTISGLSSSLPDLCLIIIGANKGLKDNQNLRETNKKSNRIENMTREHIFLCLSLKIPFAILVTKIDMIKDRENILIETLEQIQKLLQSPAIRRMSLVVKNKDDIILSAKQVHTESIVPIFLVSNVTGQGLSNLTEFLNLLPKIQRAKTTDDVELYIDSIWTVRGAGTVVGGHLKSGVIKVNDKIWIGPNNNKFETTTIRSIYCKKVSVQYVDFGSYVCLGLKKIARNDIRRGNVILSKSSQLSFCKSFKASVKILRSHSTTITVNYQPILHTFSIRQAVRILKIEDKVNSRFGSNNNSDEVLRTGDSALVTFSFLHRSEYILPGTRILLCEGMSKMLGVVKSIL